MWHIKNGKKKMLPTILHSGLDKEIIISESDVIMKQPLNSSEHIEVAQRFAGEHGIILELYLKDTIQTMYVKTLAADWISRYPEEAEYIIYGSFHSIQIVSIHHRL